MTKPLTARQAIEVRAKWLDEQWAKKYPNGEWRVIKQQARTCGSMVDGVWTPGELRPVEILILHFTKRPSQISQQVGYWRAFPETLNGHTNWRGDRYPPSYGRVGHEKYSEWKFIGKGHATDKFDRLVASLSPEIS